MEGRMNPGPASIRIREAILGCLREAGFSIEMTIQAYSVQDAYIYGFALQERSLPFESAEESTAMAEATTQHVADLAKEFPYLAEVVAGHVATVGYDFTAAFEYGLDLILDALDQRRDTDGAIRSLP
jgi:Tetracyclin repressor-like, C-terminal domain